MYDFNDLTNMELQFIIDALETEIDGINVEIITLTDGDGKQEDIENQIEYLQNCHISLTDMLARHEKERHYRISGGDCKGFPPKYIIEHFPDVDWTQFD